MPAQKINNSRFSRTAKLLTCWTGIAIALLCPQGRAHETSSAIDHLDRGEMLYQAEKYTEAMAEFQEAAREDAGLLKAWENLGWTYWKLGKIEETIRVWENIRIITPQDIRLLNILAKAYTAKNHFEQALALCRESLQIDATQKDARLHHARLMGWTRHLPEAMKELENLFAERPDDFNVRHALAQALFDSRRYTEALPHFEYLTEKEPNNIRFQLSMHKCLYRLERYDEAMAVLRAILKKDPYHVPALYQAANDALFTGNTAEARHVFKKIAQVDPSQVDALNSLARISFHLKDYPEAVDAAQKSLAANPDQYDAQLIFADALRLAGKFSDALREYHRILERNPHNIPAHIGLKELFCAQSPQALQQLQEWDPSNIYFKLDQSRLLMNERRFEEAINFLKKMNQDYASRPSVLILIYHGLTTLHRSDILKVSHFREQMTTLKESGCTTVTPEDIAAAWEGRLTLPPKTVMITFDDGMKDSFRLADPILEEFGFQAVMFIPISIIEKNHPFFSSWEDINHYQATGRWVIEAHGDQAHEDISINAQQERGTFLASKKWRAAESRPETDEEFRDRITQDYASVKQKLEERFGRTVTAFAYPKGNLGQDEFSNYAQAFPENLAAVSKFYKTAYIQNEYGFNFIGDHPHLLKRFEVAADMTREEFVNHLTLKNPAAKIKMALADTLRWAGRHREALPLYEELLRENPADTTLLAHQAQALVSMRRWPEAKTIFLDILGNRPGDLNAIAGLEKIRAAMRSSWENKFSFFEDNNTRKIMEWQETFHCKANGMLSFEPSFTRGIWQEDGIEDIQENRYALTGLLNIDENRHKLSYLYRDFSSARDAHNYLGEANFNFPYSQITITHALENVRTPKAINADVTDFRSSISGVHRFLAHWEGIGKCQFRDYSDDNTRYDLQAGIFYLPWKDLDIKFGYEYNFNDADFLSSSYYAPQRLAMHQLRIKGKGSILSRLRYDVNYGIGYASEENNAEDKIVHTLNAEWGYTIGDILKMFVAHDLHTTPSYDSQTTQAGVEVWF